MPRRTVSKYLKVRIPALHHDGYKVQQICDILAVKKSFVHKTLALLSNSGVVRKPHKHSHVGGRPRASLSTLSRAINRSYVTRKVATASKLEQNEIPCTVYEPEARDANMLLFVDRSAIDERTSFRNYGRAGKCIQHQHFIRGTRYTLHPALTLDGVIAYDIIEGSVTDERFVRFLEDYVMSFTTPYPGPRSVLVMDNCSIHNTEDVRKLVEDMHLCKLIFLPPYSPDYNPIKQAFSTIDAYLRHEDMTLTAMVRACQSITADHAFVAQLAIFFIYSKPHWNWKLLHGHHYGPTLKASSFVFMAISSFVVLLFFTFF